MIEHRLNMITQNISLEYAIFCLSLLSKTSGYKNRVFDLVLHTDNSFGASVRVRKIYRDQSRKQAEANFKRLVAQTIMQAPDLSGLFTLLCSDAEL